MTYKYPAGPGGEHAAAASERSALSRFQIRFAAGGGGRARPVPSAQHRRSRQPGARTAGRRPSSRIPLSHLHLPGTEGKMSDSSSKSSQPLASKQEKDGTEKRGRGRPRKQPPVSPRASARRESEGAQRSAHTEETPGPAKGEQKQGSCQDQENHLNSREETEGQTQKTGEGGGRGHLAGVLGGGAVTRPPAPGLASLRSHRPPPPQAHASATPWAPQAPLALVTLHSTPATVGPPRPEGRSSFGLVPSRPARPHPTHLPSWTRLVSHLAAPCACASPLPRGGGTCLGSWFGAPFLFLHSSLGLPVRELGGLPWP
ncbi:high mobility group protein HMG-I/HMG-Y isoform X1 [Dasypus novemcinctus]|uniref:high mobility group protein HMG-I/HMG-Y isoform X1 n=1 Tax=Dasypus novemcinctus TaxID=9361 RepID=UPI00265EB506|nr:high mobility group protein HMG-I/HMG-Y isoform X1 [Dasypus novemcinctus]